MKSEKHALREIRHFNRGLLNIETFLLALITLSLVIVIFIEVICRYFLFISVAWAEELSRYLFIWLTYIGSAYALYEGGHVEIDIFEQILKRGKAKERNLRVLKILSIFSTFLFLLVFGKEFLSYMLTIWAKTQTSPTMHIPMGLVYLPVFIGIVLCALHEICLLVECFAARKEDAASPAGPEMED